MQEIVEIGRATQDELRDDLRELFQGAIRLTLEMVLEEELKAMVGARRFERVGSRKDHRNGTYLRRLLTSLGQIEVAMPRSRDNGSPADVIGRYQRRSPELDEMMVEAYVSGVSQRKMGDVTEALMGERVRCEQRVAYHRTRYGGGDRADARAPAQGLAPAPGGRPEPLARHLRRELGDDALAVDAHPGPDPDGRRPRSGHRGSPPDPGRGSRRAPGGSRSGRSRGSGSWCCRPARWPIRPGPWAPGRP